MHLSKNNIIIPLDNDEKWKYVMFNALIGNVNLLSDEYFNYLKQLETASPTFTPDPAKEERLIERGYIYRQADEEKEKTQQVLDELSKTETEGKRNNYTIIHNNNCTQNCSYCSYQDRLDGASLSESDIEKMMGEIDRIEKESGAKNKPMLSIYGGDTMPDHHEGFLIFKKLIEYHERFEHIRVFTFGFKISRYREEILKLNSQKISFGFRLLENSDHNQVEEALSPAIEESFDWLRIHGFHVSLIIKITENNINKMPVYVNQFINKGHVYSNNCELNFKPTFKEQCTLFSPCSINYDLYEKIFKHYADFPQMEAANFSGHGFVLTLQNLLKARGQFHPRPFYCNANWSLLIMEPNGNVTPCYHTIANKDLSLGNILDDSQHNLDQTKLAQWRGRNVSKINQCSTCRAKYLCGGGCGYEALQKKGSLLESNCPPYEKIIKSAFELLHEDFMESARYQQVQKEYAAED